MTIYEGIWSLSSIFNEERKSFWKLYHTFVIAFVMFFWALLLNDVAKFCCEMNEVLCIDTTFNLCEHWVTDSCFGNLRLETNEGKHPIFVGPSIIYFERD